MKYKLLISDYDGTTTVGNVISQEVVNSIKEYRKNGGKFVFCTGRSEDSIFMVMKENGVEADAVISYQGSKIFADGKVLLEGGLPYELSYELIKDLRKFNKGIVAFCKDVIYYEGNDGVEDYVDFYRKLNKSNKVSDLAQTVLDIKTDVQKLVITKTPDEDVSAIYKHFDSRYGSEVLTNSGGVTLIELVAEKYSKYHAASFIANYLGVEENETITIGDSTNDLSLINFGYGIAVESGSNELKKHAKHVAPAVDKFPLSYVIDKVLKNEEFN